MWPTRGIHRLNLKTPPHAVVTGLHLSGWSSSLWFGPSATAPHPKNLPRYEPSHKASVSYSSCGTRKQCWGPISFSRGSL